VSSILITGGSGFLGHGLAKRCLKKLEWGSPSIWDRICIYSRGEYAQSKMRSEFDDSRLRWFIGDVRDERRLEQAFQGVDKVIHAAALKRIETGHYNPMEMVLTNVMGSANVIAAARRAGVKKVVLISSDKAFHPVSTYGYTKALAERMFIQANDMGTTQFSLCRYGNVAKSTGSVIPAWETMLDLYSDFHVPISDPEATRFWMTLDDAVDVVMKTLSSPKGGETFIPQELAGFTLLDLGKAMGVTQWTVTGLGLYEKKHESLSEGQSSDKARRMSVEELREEIAKL